MQMPLTYEKITQKRKFQTWDQFNILTTELKMSQK